MDNFLSTNLEWFLVGIAFTGLWAIVVFAAAALATSKAIANWSGDLVGKPYDTPLEPEIEQLNAFKAKIYVDEANEAGSTAATMRDIYAAINNRSKKGLTNVELDLYCSEEIAMSIGSGLEALGYKASLGAKPDKQSGSEMIPVILIDWSEPYAA